MITALAADKDIVFAASSVGLLRTLDGGQSWHLVFGSLKDNLTPPVSTVAIAPKFPISKTVFASIPGYILRSMDRGGNWEIAQLPTPTPFVTELAISPDYEWDHTLFAATLEDGVFRSNDSGATWYAWNFGLLDYQVLSLKIGKDHRLYACTSTGLFLSCNSGRSWNEILLPCGYAPVLSLAMFRDKMLVGTEGAGLLLGEDNGNGWQRLGEELTDTVNALVINKDALLILSHQTLLKSLDLGQTWNLIPLKDNKIATSICCSEDKIWIGYNDGTVESLVFNESQ